MEPASQEVFIRAVTAHQAGQLQDADRLYTEVLQRDPQHPAANHNLGRLAIQVGRITDALPLFQAALKANPEDGTIWISYIDALLRGDQTDTARLVLQKAREIGAEGDGFDQLEQQLTQRNPDQTSTKGISAQQAMRLISKAEKEGDVAKAIAVSQDLIARYPGHRKAHAKLKALTRPGPLRSPSDADIEAVTALCATDQYVQALRLAEDLSHRYPASFQALHVQGICHAKLGQTQKAIQTLTTALRINPDDAGAHTNLGSVYATEGAQETALAHFQQAIRIAPEYVEAHVNAGRLLVEMNQPKAAIACLEEAIRLRPDHMDALITSGDVAARMGDPGMSAQRYKAALKLQPNNLTILEKYAASLIALRDYTAAIETCGRILEQDPKNLIGLENLGIGHLHTADVDASISCLNEAIKAHPGNGVTHNNLAAAFTEKGHIDAAFHALCEAITLRPDLIDAWVNHKALAVQLGQNGSVPDSDMTPQHGLNEHPKYQILRAIDCYISGEFETSTQSLSSFRHLEKQKNLQSASYPDDSFCRGYAEFLEMLLAGGAAVIPPQDAKNTLYHIGESHCLSFAGHVLQRGNEAHVISPRICFGLKAYHLSQPVQKYRAIVERHFNAIPNGACTFLSVGEIDCRADEGLLKASAGSASDLHRLATRTIDGCVTWLAAQSSEKGHDLHILTVPAPRRLALLTDAQNAAVCDVVALYNELLAEAVHKHGLRLIDVYTPTRDRDGFSNGRYHCDNRHLDHRILPEIAVQMHL